MKRKVCAFFAFSSVVSIFGALPDVQKCNLTDAVCLKTSAQSMVPQLTDGLPDLGSKVLDPLYVEAIKVDLAGLKLALTDAQITGMKDTIIDKLSVDLAKKQIQVICHVSVYLKGKYKASGKLLILPITGDGDTTIKLKNLRIQMIYPFNLVKNSEGKDVIDLSSYRYSYDVKDNAHFHMTNLFNGNKQLGDVMLTFMNQNWKALTQEFGKPLLEIPMEMVYNTVKTYLKSQPLEDIANL
ncbi:circadian clock-controlled protein daywake isoform X1 [Bombyx mori]|uniref:Uncharacterized protein n=2 Tax=Bombyx mori TaxID=7091 RepID=A0A8R1WL65_BOMMO|nr:circadian clock-controlled protein daywake-like isoform X1 [Bombyx mori]